MRERPILFSAPMVRAILAVRKMQTRRIVKLPSGMEECNEDHEFELDDDPPWPYAISRKTGWLSAIECPYGEPGDRLWVRETLRRTSSGVWSYGADGALVSLPNGHPDVSAMLAWAHHKEGDACVSIHMPRWASRILLEVTGVRVERLAAISDDDCRAEGCAGGHGSIPGYGYSATPREHYRHVWESINGTGSWDANPWVWVVEFRRITEAKG